MLFLAQISWIKLVCIVACFIRLFSNFSNSTEELEKDFPFWSHLHGFWHTLPNINPHTVSLEPGQDLEAEAICHMSGEGLHNITADYDDNTEELTGNSNQTTSQWDDLEPSDIDEPPRSQVSLSHASSYGKLPTASGAPSYTKHSTAGSTKVSGNSTSKWSWLEAFREENQNCEKNLVKLATKQLDFKTAELAVKKQKLKITNTQELEKEQMATVDRDIIFNYDTVSAVYVWCIMVSNYKGCN